MGRLVSKLYKGNIRGLSFLELHEAQVKDAMNYLTVSEVYVYNYHESNRSSLLSISELLILCLQKCVGLVAAYHHYMTNNNGEDAVAESFDDFLNREVFKT